MDREYGRECVRDFVAQIFVIELRAVDGLATHAVAQRGITALA